MYGQVILDFYSVHLETGASTELFSLSHLLILVLVQFLKFYAWIIYRLGMLKKHWLDLRVLFN